MSNQANTHAAWNDTKNFWTRQVQSVSVEERDLLEDWEFVLCDPVALKKTVALRPRLQRCFKRVDSLLTERGEAVKKIGARYLQLALRSRHMLQFPMSTFARVFLERYSDELAAEQIEPMAVREEKICEVSAADCDAASVHRCGSIGLCTSFFCTVCR